jgi:hypothetical protein
MSLLRSIAAGLQSLFRKEQVSSELDEELDGFLEMAAEEKMKRGMSRKDALRAVRLERGSLEVTKESLRSAGWESSVETLWHDVRFSARMMRKSPGFTTVVVITLALGIGANTAIFSVINSVLLRPLPYRESSRLIVLNETTPKVGDVSVSYQNFLDWRTASHTFSQMVAVASVDFNLAGVTQPENISGDAVSPNFLSMMGVRPILGRDFDASEEKAGTAPVVLLSYAL